MAISTSDNILALLKVFYRDGVENLMFRNSPVLKKIEKTRVEGKEQAFAAMYGRGGAVGGDYTAAAALAAEVSKNVEFKVLPGQLFSVYSMNAKEIQASKTNKGAYMKVAGNKMFAASEGFRKTMAAALYGRGYGELCFAPTTALTTGSTGVDIVLPNDAIMKIDVDSKLVVKTAIDQSAVQATLTVEKINGNTVHVTSDTAYTPAATDVICLNGAMNNGEALLPMGLDGWLPVVNKRSGAAWTTYIGTKFFDVKRDVASDRLAGCFYSETSATAKKADAIQALIQKVRRQGSQADLIVMNDEDFLDFSKEIESTNTFFTQTSTKAKKQASVGIADMSASFSTNFIENIIDDSYCPKGKFYVLDTTAVELWSYTNAEKINDGVAGNEPGKQEVMAMENDGKETDPYGLIIDDYLSIQPGTATVDGPSSLVSLQFFGSFVVTNPSVCGVGLFYNASPIGV